MSTTIEISEEIVHGLDFQSGTGKIPEKWWAMNNEQVIEMEISHKLGMLKNAKQTGSLIKACPTGSKVKAADIEALRKSLVDYARRFINGEDLRPFR